MHGPPPQVALIVLAACGLSDSTTTTARYISLLRLLKLVGAPEIQCVCSSQLPQRAGLCACGSFDGGAREHADCSCRAAPTASASSSPTWSST
jgi:hypothetical protein